jgi:hypothetical protein
MSEREVQVAGRVQDRRLATLRSTTEYTNDLPHIRAGSKSRATTCRAVAEHDPRVILDPDRPTGCWTNAVSR